jgi:hypothetical protein
MRLSIPLGSRDCCGAGVVRGEYLFWVMLEHIPQSLDMPHCDLSVEVRVLQHLRHIKTLLVWRVARHLWIVCNGGIRQNLKESYFTGGAY